MLWVWHTAAEAAPLDSLRRIIARKAQDTNSVKALNAYAMQIHETFPDSTRLLAQQALQLSETLHYAAGKAMSLNYIGVSHYIQNNYEKALESYLQALRAHEQASNMTGVSAVLNNVGMVYRDMKNFTTALTYYFRARHLNDSLGNTLFLSRNLNNIGIVYEELGMLDSALWYHSHSLTLKQQLKEQSGIATSLRNIGKVQLTLGRLAEALVDLRRSLTTEGASKQTRAQALLDVSEVYVRQQQPEQARDYAERALLLAQEMRSALLQQQAHEALSRHAKLLGNPANALSHYQTAVSIRDSLFNEQSSRRLAALQTNYELERQRNQIELLTKDKALEQNVKNSLIIVSLLLAVLLTLAAVAYRSKRKSEQQLRATNEDLDSALTQLQSAQTQLVHSEKMAAVGQLTAGMMHEINNPNAMVSSAVQTVQERLDEVERYFFSLVSEEDKTSQAAQHFAVLVKDARKIASLAETGSERITAIVAQLQQFSKHQRSELYESWLHDELGASVEMARYQFTATTFTLTVPESVRFAAHWGELNHVWMNALLNAAEAGATAVNIMATAQNNVLNVEIADNGNGMSTEVLKRAFEPFFTTKPVGKGTGLGLAIAYSTVQKHHGSMNISSAPNKGTTVIITLPIPQKNVVRVIERQQQQQLADILP
jgi:signal transduction histidine kinase